MRPPTPGAEVFRPPGAQQKHPRRDIPPVAGFRFLSVNRHPPERPVVQQQQHQRQRDQHGLGRQPEGEQGDHRQIANQREAAARVAGVGRQGEHEEQAAEHVFAFGDPSDRFHAQRMDGEQGRRQCARPEIAGHPPQQQEQKNCRGGMERYAGEVMSLRFLPVKAVIKNMGKPRQGVPIAGVVAAERPADGLRGEALLNLRVRIDILVVIIVDELIADRLAEDQPDRQQQPHADRQHARAGRPAGRRSFKSWVTLGFLGHGMAGVQRRRRR